jgi:glycosyltransferase involved in cell wall biosynthesis
MIDDTKAATIAAALNKLLTDDNLYNEIRRNCLKARQALNWSNEEKKLIAFYEKLLNESTVQASDTRNVAIKN